MKKCKLCGFKIGDRVHMRSAVMPGKALRGVIESWGVSCGHLAAWKEITDVTKDGKTGKYEPFEAVMATPTYSPDMREGNTNVVLVTEKLPEVRLG
jgi:hypothetical protein